MGSPARLLDGIRVLDAASWLAAPVATTVMADLGADVIKIEPPPGDGLRGLYRQPGLPPTEHNYPWLVANRGKRGLALDLARDEGRAVLDRLLRSADVFVTNLPLNSRARLRLCYEDLAPLNDRLIYASLTAYGETGEEASKPGFDALALWARTGLMDLMRASPESPPVRSLPGMGDNPSGLTLFAAIMAALYQRERTGKGASVSTSLMANGLWWNAIAVQGALCGAPLGYRPPKEATVNALTNMYRCRDGRWFLLTMLAEERDWPRFAACIGRSDLIQDRRFATTTQRHAHARDLAAILDEVFAARDWTEWRAALEATDIAFGIIGTLGDVVGDRQMHASGALAPVHDPRLGASLVVANPIRIEGQDKTQFTAAPALGEHSVEILREAGFAVAEIERLLGLGVISQARLGDGA
jgi:crotonobetainyl-CoA:carnitine CoA-transferase CaiB-like acyl-CoA transferase